MLSQLISLEGIDASGKTSIAKALEKKIGAHYIHSPPKEYVLLREDIKEMEAIIEYELFLSGNKHIIKEINGFLELKQSVIIEPYIYATIAFGAVNLGKEIYLPPGLLEPDQIIYVTASWREIEKRLLMKGKKRKNHENIYNLKKFKEVYDQLLIKRDDVIIVDTTRKDVNEIVKELLPKLNLL